MIKMLKMKMKAMPMVMTIVMTMKMVMMIAMVKRSIIGMRIMMIVMTLHLFKTRSKPLLNIFTVSEAIVQVGRVVLSCWGAC